MQLAPDMEFAARLCPHFLHGDTLRQINQRELSFMAVYIECAKLRDNLAHRSGASQRERTLLQDLGAAVLRAVFHYDDNLRLVRTRDQIHSTAHACANL